MVGKKPIAFGGDLTKWMAAMAAISFFARRWVSIWNDRHVWMDGWMYVTIVACFVISWWIVYIWGTFCCCHFPLSSVQVSKFFVRWCCCILWSKCWSDIYSVEFMRTKCRWGDVYIAEQPIRCFVATNSNTSSCNLNCPRAENRIRIKDYLECPSQSPLASMLYISRSRSHSPILS